MMVDVLLSDIPTPGPYLKVKVTDLEFSYSVFALEFIQLYYQDLLMNFMCIWHDGRYRSRVLLGRIPTPGVTLRSQTYFHIKVKMFTFMFI